MRLPWCPLNRITASNLIKLCQEHSLNSALHALELWLNHGIPVCRDTVYDLIQTCSKTQNLKAARELLSVIESNGLWSASVLCDHLIRCFGMCNSLQDAVQVFQNVSKPTNYTWNAMVSVHVNCGECKEALAFYHQMKAKGFMPDEVTILNVLKACSKLTDMEEGHLAHGYVIKMGMDLNMVLGNTLVDTYAKCGAISEAHKTFDHMPKRSVVSWSTLIYGYSKLGQSSVAFKLFDDMHQNNVCPDRAVFLSILRCCVRVEALRVIHGYFLDIGLVEDLHLGSCLFGMYAKFGTLDDAQKVFDQLPYHDVVSWGILIEGYTMHGDSFTAIKLFEQMQRTKIKPSKVLLLSVLKACANVEALIEGHLVHDQIMREESQLDLLLLNTLIDMYAKCGSVKSAYKTFNTSCSKDVVTWAVMISGVVAHDINNPALQLYDEMREEGIQMNDVICISILQACGSLAQVMLIHNQILQVGLQPDDNIGSTLVQMYGRYGSFDAAENVFDQCMVHDVVLWGALISCCILHGKYGYALVLALSMQAEGLKPDATILADIVVACGKMQNLEMGRIIHNEIVFYGHESEEDSTTALIEMYAICGCLSDASELLTVSESRDTDAWRSMITSCVADGKFYSAIEIYDRMDNLGCLADPASVHRVVKACSCIGALEKGKSLYNQLIKRGVSIDAVFGNVLVEMYVGCGCSEEAHKVFDLLPNRDIVSYGTLMAGYAVHGNHVAAQRCLQAVTSNGFIKPDAAFFSSLLSSFCRSAEVERGCSIFQMMTEQYGIEPDMQNCSCLIDLLVRAGHLAEAEDLIKIIPFLPDHVSIVSLLSGCITHGNAKLGYQCFHNAALNLGVM